MVKCASGAEVKGKPEFFGGVKYSKGAQWNKQTGEVKWTLNLPANGAEKLTLAYTVKYPKDRHVTGL